MPEQTEYDLHMDFLKDKFSDEYKYIWEEFVELIMEDLSDNNSWQGPWDIPFGEYVEEIMDKHIDPYYWRDAGPDYEGAAFLRENFGYICDLLFDYVKDNIPANERHGFIRDINGKIIMEKTNA